MHQLVLYLYHPYLNHPGGGRLANPIHKVCYWKLLAMKSDLSVNQLNKYQHFKKRKRIYGYLSPNIKSELKSWNLMRIYLIVLYTKSIIKHESGGAIRYKDIISTLMTKIDPTLGWFEIVRIPLLNIYEVTSAN